MPVIRFFICYKNFPFRYRLISVEKTTKKPANDSGRGRGRGGARGRRGRGANFKAVQVSTPGNYSLQV
jgi:hypothetical protein